MTRQPEQGAGRRWQVNSVRRHLITSGSGGKRQRNGDGAKKCAGKADLGGGSESGDIFCSLWGFCQIMISRIVWEYRKEKRGIRMHYNDSSSQYSMQDLTDIILHPGGSSSVDSEVYLRSVSLENSLIELTSADSALKFNKCWFHKKNAPCTTYTHSGIIIAEKLCICRVWIVIRVSIKQKKTCRSNRSMQVYIQKFCWINFL